MTTPYVINVPTVAGNVAQTLANLTALRLEIMANPRPKYSVDGHSYDWVGFYKFISDEINTCMKQLGQLEPFEIVSIAR